MLAGALAAVPGAASGQTRDTAMTLAAARLAPSVPSLFSPAWPEARRIEEPPDRLLELPQVRNRRGVPFMIAGGAMFLAGAIIGDDGGTILVLGGIGVGAYGAYIYFR
jgi:hypothetical protein